MKSISALALACFVVAPVFAASPACAKRATEMKLSGASLVSFVRKCERDLASSVTSTCERAAAGRRMAGAARNRYVKQCLRDNRG